MRINCKNCRSCVCPTPPDFDVEFCETCGKDLRKTGVIYDVYDDNPCGEFDEIKNWLDANEIKCILLPW